MEVWADPTVTAHLAIPMESTIPTLYTPNEVPDLRGQQESEAFLYEYINIFSVNF